MINHSNVNLNTFQDRKAMVDALTLKVINDLKCDIEVTGHASWAVSGGSTPKPLFEGISKHDLNWKNIQIALVDERWVPPSHPRSNETFVKSTLMKNNAQVASFTGMYVDDQEPETAIELIESTYKQIKQPFTSILLGMGNDGHTASLFPAAQGLEDALSANNKKTCAALKAIKSDVTGDEVERISLTFNAVNTAKNCILMITGNEKIQTLSRALAVDINLPIARVINSMSQPLDIFWAPSR